MKKRFLPYAIAVCTVFMLLAVTLTFFPFGYSGAYGSGSSPAPEPYRMTGENTPKTADINSVSLLQMRYLPYLTMEQKSDIITLRDRLGGYTSLEQLCFVKGIGPVRLEMLAGYFYIE